MSIGDLCFKFSFYISLVNAWQHSLPLVDRVYISSILRKVYSIVHVWILILILVHLRAVEGLHSRRSGKE